MSSIHEAIATPAKPGLREFVDRYFYFGISLIAATFTVWGFSHTIDMNLLHPAVPRPLILWIHGAAFSAWLVFFILQSALVRTRNVQLHRSLGWVGAGLAAFMVVMGVSTAIVMGRFDIGRLQQPAAGAEAFLMVPFTDMLAFGTFVALAVYFRKKPNVHRPFMLFATCALLDAAFGRFEFLFDNALFYACVDGLIFLGVIRDLVVDRRVNAAYYAGLPALMALQVFSTYAWRAAPSWWIRIAHAIIG
jgi:hypothetical protein